MFPLLLKSLCWKHIAFLRNQAAFRICHKGTVTVPAVHPVLFLQNSKTLYPCTPPQIAEKSGRGHPDCLSCIIRPALYVFYHSTEIHSTPHPYLAIQDSFRDIGRVACAVVAQKDLHIYTAVRQKQLIQIHRSANALHLRRTDPIISELYAV